MINKKRFIKLLTLLILVAAIGFFTKFYFGPYKNLINFHLGGFFYVIFWCLFFALIFPDTSTIKITSGVFIITCCLEFLQLWKPVSLQEIRSTFIGHALIGSYFSWSDFPWYAAGCILSFFVIKKNINPC